jgi:hypothetical protein
MFDCGRGAFSNTNDVNFIAVYDCEVCVYGCCQVTQGYPASSAASHYHNTFTIWNHVFEKSFARDEAFEFLCRLYTLLRDQLKQKTKVVYHV